jgi:hypothetical protein
LALLVPLVPTNIDNVTTTNQNEEIDVLVNDDNASMDGMDDMEEEDEHFFMHSTHQKSSAKLMLLLDSWGVPNDAFQHIVEWYEMSRLHDVSFHDKSKSRAANLEELRRCIPHQLASRWLPHIVPVQLLGFRDTVDLVRFDAVEMILSLLQDDTIMVSENLVINPENPFDNYRCGLDSGKEIGEPRMGSVYQNYLRQRNATANEFIVVLFI